MIQCIIGIEMMLIVIMVVNFVYRWASGAISYIRCKAVLAERLRVLDEMHRKTMDDMQCGRPYKWRYHEHESISYYDMMRQWWKPVGSFYKDHPCLSDTQPKTGEENHDAI
jgi:hypothetical protein